MHGNAIFDSEYSARRCLTEEMRGGNAINQTAAAAAAAAADSTLINSREAPIGSRDNHRVDLSDGVAVGATRAKANTTRKPWLQEMNLTKQDGPEERETARRQRWR
jgi:hypothetical protein